MNAIKVTTVDHVQRSGRAMSSRGSDCGRYASAPAWATAACALLMLAAALLATPVAAQNAAQGGPGIHTTGNATVITHGHIQGGLDATATVRAPAVAFTGGGNTLELQVGYSFTGQVISDGGGDTLALGGEVGGTGNGSFDVGQIGVGFLSFASFAKNGTSTWTLTGANNATDWAIHAGTLAVDGSVGDISVDSGALAGSGTVAAIALHAGAAIAPGGSPGTLHAASLTWDGGGSFDFQLGNSAAGSDLLALSGYLLHGGGAGFVFHFSDGGGAPQVGVTYPLIAFTSTQGFATSDFSYDYSGALGSISGHFVLGASQLGFVVDSVEHYVGGTVTGLIGSGLTLILDSGNQSLPISADGSFVFPIGVAEGTSYQVSIASQPSAPDQQCVVINASGSVPAHDVNNVVVNCGAANTWTVGGTLGGLTGGSVTLTINGGNPVTLSANGSYVFPVAFVYGSSYLVTISAQPAGQYCTLANASGSVAGANVSNVDVNCQAAGPQLSLGVTDAGDYARYGQVRTYLVSLVNHGLLSANNVALSGDFDAAFDQANVHWQCLGGSSNCTSQGQGGFNDSATLAPGTSLTWLVDVPVRANATAASATFTVHAGGAIDASDNDTLVIFRDGLDVPYADGTQARSADATMAALSADHGDLLLAWGLPRGPGVHNVWVIDSYDARIRVQGLRVHDRGYVRLALMRDGRTLRTSAWAGIADDAVLAVGSVADDAGHRILLLEGASAPLRMRMH